MPGKQVYSKKEEDDYREALVKELEKYKDFYSRQGMIIRRYEWAASRNSIFKSLYDLEVGAESFDSLRNMERKRQHHIDLQSEELAVQNEEMIAQLEEINLQAEELRRTNEALQASEKKYRELVEQSNSIIIRWDTNGKIKFINDFAEKFFGFSQDEVMGKSLFNTIIPVTDSNGRDMAAFIHHVKQHPEKYKNNVNENIRKSGERVWVSWSNKAILDELGNLIEILAVGNDITKLKRAKEALQENVERLRMAQQVARIGTFEWNIQTGVNIWTPELEAMYGLPVGGFPGAQSAWEQLVYHEDRAEAVRRVSEAIEKGDFEGEWRVVWPDGTVHWLHGKGWVFKDESGKPLKLLGVNIDITERKQAEKSLDAVKDQLTAELDAMDRLHAISVQFVLNGDLSAILDQIIDVGVSITNADMGNIQILDPESGCLKIVAQHGFDQPFLDYFDTVVDGHGSCGESMNRKERVVVEDVARSPIFVGTPDLEAMRAAGVRAVQSTPLLSRKGRLLGMFSTHYRVSRRPNEREQKLIDLLARQTADIIERTQAEKQLFDSKAQAELYLDLMGHDINNMHQVALGYLEMARDLPSGEMQAEFIDKSMEVLRRSTQLIGNVRKLRKIHEGVFQSKDIDVCKLLADVQSEYGKVAGKTVALNMNGHDGCRVRANELLHDVFANLVNNAVNHTEDGREILVKLDVVEDNGSRYCRVSVEDDGPGIHDDYKERVFNRMYRGTARGMGLGLFIVKSLVDSYHGKVWVEDRVPGDYSKGTKFVVMLPALMK
jgi:PAS domain S-box-containing protein